MRLRDVMPPTSPDPVVAAACSHGGYVLVTHDKDFRNSAKVLGITQRVYRSSLHKVLLKCSEPTAKDRVAASLSLIEHEWTTRVDGCAMVIEITESAIRVLR